MIDLSHITKSYQLAQETLTVLKDVSLFIKQGEFVAIMGPSGSGKSTLMNIIGLLDVPTSGSYTLEGVNVEALGADDQARIRGKRIGFVFQAYNLVPRLTAIEQVALPLMYQGISRSERTRRAREALERVGLGNRINSRPSELSGGQQQRVSIARALVIAPALILADEPTGALDSKTSVEVIDLFKALHAEGKTIVMITHDDEIAVHARRVVRVRDGVIVSDEPQR